MNKDILIIVATVASVVSFMGYWYIALPVAFVLVGFGVVWHISKNAPVVPSGDAPVVSNDQSLRLKPEGKTWQERVADISEQQKQNPPSAQDQVGTLLTNTKTFQSIPTDNEFLQWGWRLGDWFNRESLVHAFSLTDGWDGARQHRFRPLAELLSAIGIGEKA